MSVLGCPYRRGIVVSALLSGLVRLEQGLELTPAYYGTLVTLKQRQSRPQSSIIAKSNVEQVEWSMIQKLCDRQMEGRSGRHKLRLMK